MKRANAFTIIELCVVMLLSAIVTGIAFFTLNIFQNSVRRYKSDAGQMADLALLHRLLAQDFWQSRQIRHTEEGIQVLGRKGTVSYAFSPNYILRSKEDLVDTFHFEHGQLLRRFEQEEIVVPGLLVDEISFDLIHKGESQPFYFYKRYAADVLMQQKETKAIHDGWH